MRLSSLLAIAAVLTGSLAATAPAYAAAPSCHFLPVANSSADLRHALSVGVIYSENTLNTIEYLEQYHAVAVNGARNPQLDSRISSAFVRSSEPTMAIDWLMGSLQKEFASVKVYGSLDAVVQAHPDVVVMLDSYSRLVSKRNPQVQARFLAKFYDSNLQYIGQAEGSREKQMPSLWVHGKAAPEIAAQIDQQTELQVNALKQFDTSLKALVSAGDVAQVATK